MYRRILTVMLLLPAMAQAADDWAISSKAGTLGVSVELGRSLGTSINGRLSANLFSYDDSLTESGVHYDASLDLRSAGLLFDWHPRRSAFRVTLGGLYNGNEAGLEAQSVAGTFNLNGVNYNATDVGSLLGQVQYKKAAPYLGIGWGNIGSNKRGWGMAWDMGVLYQGSPDVMLNVNCAPTLSAAQCTSLESDVSTESQQLRNDIDEQKWFPVFSLGVLYRF